MTRAEKIADDPVREELYPKSDTCPVCKFFQTLDEAFCEAIKSTAAPCGNIPDADKWDIPPMSAMAEHYAAEAGRHELYHVYQDFSTALAEDKEFYLVDDGGAFSGQPFKIVHIDGEFKGVEEPKIHMAFSGDPEGLVHKFGFVDFCREIASRSEGLTDAKLR